MEQYVPKSVVLTEIKKRRDAALMRQRNLEAIGQESVVNEMVANELNMITSFIDTLEVKEADFEKEIEDYLDNVGGQPRMWHSDEQIEWAKDIARHFYGLGLKVRKEEVE